MGVSGGTKLSFMGIFLAVAGGRALDLACITKRVPPSVTNRFPRTRAKKWRRLSIFDLPSDYLMTVKMN
jgi:hypothetical protein